MTVIRPNSISGINSITAQVSALNFYDSAGAALPVTAGAINVDNINATGVSTFANATIAGGSITGVSTIGVTTVTATNLTVNGNAYPSAGPLSNRNRIINGDMRIDQRNAGVSTAITSGLSYYLDRWQVRGTSSSGGSGTVSQYNDNGVKKFRLTTSGFTSNSYIQQMIESQNIRDLAGKQVTISVSASATPNIDIYSYDSSNVESTVTSNQSMTSLGDNRYSYTTTLPSGQIGQNDNSRGILVVFLVNGGENPLSDGTYDFWDIQLEAGNVATPFEHRSYGDELQRCQRYYQVITGWGLVIGSSSTTEVRTGIRYSPPMRDVPSFSLSKALKIVSPGVGESNQSSAAVNITGQSGSSTQYGAILSFGNFSSITSQQAYLAPWDNTQLFASAEL